MMKYFLIGMFLTSSLLVQAQPVATLPFQKQGNHTFIKIKINESKEELLFLFDTGAGSTVIDINVAKELSLKHAERDTLLETAGGNYKVAISMDNSINLPGLHFSGINFFIDDLSHIHFAGEPVAGVIGYELLKTYPVQLNYVTQEILFCQNSNTSVFNEYQALPIEIVDEIPAMRLTFTTSNGLKKSGLFYIDSGAGFSMSFNSDYAKKELQGAYNKKHNLAVMDASNNAGFDTYLASIKELNIGPNNFTDLPVSISGAEEGITSTSIIDGLIGAEVLKRFTIIFDYPLKNVRLIPNENYLQPFTFNLTGLVFKTVNKAVIVTHVISDSPADIAGFKVNDIFLTINQKTYYTSAELRAAINVPQQSQKCEVLRGINKLVLELNPKRFY